MPNNRYVRFREKQLTKSLNTLFNKEYRAFIAILRKYDTQKGFFNDMEVLLGRLRDGVVEVLKERTKVTIQKGSDVNAQKFNPWFTISFDVVNSEASNYIQLLEDLHLSEKQWSIYRTTKAEILEILDQWVNEWLSYGQLADKIEETQPFVFSKARAELIAVTEIWRAYEFWNWLPMKDIQDQWWTVLKEWITAWDDKVRASHNANSSDWFIPLDQRFSWTGDLYAPAKRVDPFRCRCATWYKVL